MRPATPRVRTGASRSSAWPRDRVGLRVDAPGLATWYWPSTVDHVAVGAHITIEMEREGVIEGRVLREGEPVPGVAVRASPEDHFALDGEAVTDEDGRYRIGRLRPATYSLRADPARPLVGLPTDGIRVAVGDTAAGVVLQVIEGIPVRGTVALEQTGEPVAGLRVTGAQIPTARNWDAIIRSDAVTDDHGRYELHLPPGEVIVGCSDEDWRAEPRRAELDLTPAGARADFTVRPASDAASTVAGLVLDVQGDPAPGALIYGTEPYYGPPARDHIVADERGRFSIPTPRAERLLFATDRDGLAVAVEILEAGHWMDVWLRLEPAAWAESRVVDTEGRPVPRVAASVRLAGRPLGHRGPGGSDLPATGVGDADGRLRIGPLPPGRALVFEPSWNARRMLVEDVWEPLGEITLQPGETFELPELVLSPDGRALEGRILDLAGDPAEGATVLSTSGIHTRVMTTSGGDGRFRLEGLKTLGEVGVLGFTADGTRAAGTKCDPDDWPRPVRGHPATAEPEELTLVLRPLAALEGVVRVADGAPAAGVQVSAVTYDISRTAALHHRLKLQTATPTGEDGRWRVEHLIPGLEYRVYAHDPRSGDTSEFERVTIGEAEPADIELIMRGR